MLKVVYFDEESAMDLISIKNGGNLIEQAINTKDSGNEVSGGAKTSISAGKGIRKLLDMFLVDVDGQVKFNSNLYRENNSFIESTLSNTILTDFITLVNRQRKTPKEVKILKNYKVEIVKDSIAYFQRISPYLIFTEGRVDIGEGLNMEINKLQDALKLGKGYYELLAMKGTEEIILRFNNSVFKNNYSISDLDQMELVFYGIKVGNMDKKLLNFETLMGKYSGNNKVQDDVFEITKQEISNESEKNIKNNELKLDVYDVLLAGVNH